jgi:tetratricopeptide (TPR) repeat protein
MISQPLFPVGKSPVFAGLFESRHGITLNRSLPAPVTYASVLLMRRKVTLKLIVFRIRVVNAMGSYVLRAAVEKHPRDAEAWIGLAASYDRLRRFDLADRAYGQAVGIVGPTVEILNNQGFSYMLRGDYKRAHAALAAAQRKDPGNKYVQNNLRLLEESYRKGKSVE